MEGKLEKAKRTLTENVNKWLTFYLDQEPERFYHLGSEIIPLISREQVKRWAAFFFMAEEDESSIRYVPDYQFGKDDNAFSKQVYLLYLERGVHLEKALARQWIKKYGADMYRQKIIYSCIREELALIKETFGHRLKKALAIKKAVTGKEGMLLCVRFQKGSQIWEVSMPGQNLLDDSGYYPFTGMAGGEQQLLSRLFREEGKLAAEMILTIYIKNEILYDAGRKNKGKRGNEYE